MNSSVGWNSLSRAGKLSPEGDFSKFEKSAGGRFAAEGREMSPTRSRLNTQHSEVEEVS